MKPKLSDIATAHLVAAYDELYPGEMGEDIDTTAAFGPWLDAVRAGHIHRQFALDQSFTAKKTRSLLLLLEIDEPVTVAELPALIGITPSARTRIEARAERLRKLKPPSSDD
jgi:hypothetical protein